MREVTDFARELGFTVPWFDLGVIDATGVDSAKARWDLGEDRNTEHYRYRAFREFLSGHRPLATGLAEALFDLGAEDPDHAMGGAMMADVVRLPECPQSVLNRALTSDRKYLVTLVERRNQQQT